MTRNTNRFFLALGVAGVVSLFVMNSVNPSVFKDGFHIVNFGIELDILLYMFFGTFISLGWFGVMPIIGTYMHLDGFFDHPKYQYMYRWPIYRFIVLIVDHPKVLARQRAGN
jgi:hypothetical protein